MFVTLAAVFVITGPTFALYFERRLIIRLALVVVFSLIFAMMLAVMTACKNQEMFAIVAALVCLRDLVLVWGLWLIFESRYAAVLIVFVGNALNNNG